MKLKLLIAYDGAAFLGWQSQAGGCTVQDALEAAFFNICGRRIPVHGAGRTDAGVHALGQVAHAEPVDRNWSTEKWLNAINGNLPPGVRILRLTRAPKAFHARFSATGKVYRYRIQTGPALHPLEIGRCWHVPGSFDHDLFAQAAAQLVGTHDFRAFAANRGKPDENTIRTLYNVRIKRSGALTETEFDGDGFLYRMVRLLTGTLVRIAAGRRPIGVLPELLAGRGRGGPTAPAHGLYLVRVRYGR